MKGSERETMLLPIRTLAGHPRDSAPQNCNFPFNSDELRRHGPRFHKLIFKGPSLARKSETSHLAVVGVVFKNVFNNRFAHRLLYVLISAVDLSVKIFAV